jgi:hypothetical protein
MIEFFLNLFLILILGTYEFANDEIPIKFHTDSNGSDAGFVILVKQIQC